MKISIHDGYDECLSILDSRPLNWCQDQAYCLPHNEKYKTVPTYYRKALVETINKKKERGETIPAKFKLVMKEEENGTVQMIPCGGKGQMVRVVVPSNYD